MKEFSLFEKISAALVGLAGLLYVITYVVALAGGPSYGTPTGVFVVNGIGNLVYALLIFGALIFAVVERRLLVGIIVASLKITLPYGSSFIRTALAGGSMDFGQAGTIFGLLFFLLAIGLIVMLVFVAKETKFESTPFKWLSFLDPILVFAYLILFDSFSNALITSLAEVVASLLLAAMTAELLFISVFVRVPFAIIITIIESTGNGPKPTITFGLVLEWVLGILLLAYGIYALIVHIRHSRHEKHEDIPQPQKEPALE